MIRCVLIDRDKAAQEALPQYLESYGISVCVGESEADLRHLLDAPNAVDIVVFDLALADGDVAALCHWVHASLHKPLIVVTEHSDLVKRVVALESGADDYIDRPYDQRELIARIRAVLRRAVAVQGAGGDSVAL